MKKFFQLLLPVLALVSCSKEADAPRELGTLNTQRERPVMHGEIVLGKKLDNPYAIENVRKAMRDLYPTRAAQLAPNGLYVRFLPEGEEQVNRLAALGLEFFDHPLDYEILQEGDYYHDRSLSRDRITWQYTLVPPDFVFPEGIRYELLEKCYVPDDDVETKASADVDWDLVEREAFRMTGNKGLLLPETRGRRVRPKGRITLEDGQAKSGKIAGVAGVKVRTNVFVRFSSAYTDKDGYYEIRKKYASKPHYCLEFKNSKGFSIGLNLIFVQASTSTLGKGAPSGMDVKVGASSDGTLFRRCVVNNAAYDFIAKCGELGICTPPRNLRIWIFKCLNPSSSLMMHHGAILNHQAADKFLGIYRFLLRIFMPDITIGAKDKGDFASLYSATIHEMAHSSHFQQVGTAFWNKYITYVLTSYAGTGSSYGDGSGSEAGYCEVGEMWAYYLENKVFKERYGYSRDSGYDRWFHPQIFAMLEKNGMTASQIFGALRPDVTDRESLSDKLAEQNPAKKSVITRAFKQYSR